MKPVITLSRFYKKLFVSFESLQSKPDRSVQQNMSPSPSLIFQARMASTAYTSLILRLHDLGLRDYNSLGRSGPILSTSPVLNLLGRSVQLGGQYARCNGELDK